MEKPTNLCHCEERSDAAILKPKVWHPVARHGAPARRISNISEIKMVGFLAKPTIFVSLRGRIAPVAILKPKVWYPVARHGAPARRISNISEIKMVGFLAKPTIFVSLRGAQRRGNLKAEGMASRTEARLRPCTDMSPRDGRKAECGRRPHSAHLITFYASKSSKSSKSESV